MGSPVAATQESPSHPFDVSDELHFSDLLELDPSVLLEQTRPSLRDGMIPVQSPSSEIMEYTSDARGEQPPLLELLASADNIVTFNHYSLALAEQNEADMLSAATITINPATNWTNIPAAGGAQRTITVTTNFGGYWLSAPYWVIVEFIGMNVRLTARPNNEWIRTGTVRFSQFQNGSGASRSFTVTQLAGQITPTLTINPTTNWNAPAAGQTRTVNVTTNLSTYRVYGRPSLWMDIEFLPGTTGFRLTARPNSGGTRTATITVRGEGVPDRSFAVTQLAGQTAPFLTINPTTNWTNIPAAGGAVREVTVSHNLPGWWLWTPYWIDFAWTNNGVRLTARPNNGAARNNYSVWFTERQDGGGLARSFTVSQLAAAGGGVPTRPANPAQAGWVMPNANFRHVTSRWNAPRANGPHIGVDLIASTGATRGANLVPVADGTVRTVGLNTCDAGFFVIYELDQLHWQTGVRPAIIYMHLLERPPVNVNARVFRGSTVVGRVGSSGFSTGYHLHFEIRRNGPANWWVQNINQTENPLLYFPNVNFTGALSAMGMFDDQIQDEYIRESRSANLPDGITIIDSALMDYVGNVAFMQWLNATVRANPDRLYTVLDFLEYFNISLDQYTELMSVNAMMPSSVIQHIVEYAQSIAASQSLQKDDITYSPSTDNDQQEDEIQILDEDQTIQEE